MPITVTQAASVTDMTQLHTIKDELGITGTDEDKTLGRYIKQASEAVRTYTGREFVQERLTETLPSFGDRILRLSRRPLVTVHSVSFRGSEVDSSEYSIYDAGAGFIWREKGWTSTEYFLQRITSFPTGEADILWSVDYTAGFKMPGETGADLPADLERVCIELAKTFYVNKGVDSAVVTRRIGSALEHRSMDKKSGLPSGITSMLDKYKEVWVQ